MKNNYKEEFFTCTCKSPDHLIYFRLDQYAENDKELSVYVGLNHYLSFWKRIKLSFKYIFGLSSVNPFYFDTVLLNKEQANKISKLLEEFK